MTDGPQYPQYPDQPAPDPQQQPSQQPPPAQAPPSYGSVPQPPPLPAHGQPAYGQPPYGPPGQWGAPQPYPGHGYGYGPQTRTNQMAVWSMVLGIISIVFCYLGLIIGPVAIGLAIAARRSIAAKNGAETGGGMALAGLITGIVGTVIQGALIALVAISVATG